MWIDLQQAFYLVFAEFLQSVVMPVFIASGVLLALINPLSRFWRPTEKISLDAGWDRDE